MKNKIFIGLIFGCFLNVFGQSHVNCPQDGIYAGIESGVARVIVSGTFGNKPVIDENEFINENYTKSVIGINLGYGKYIDESLIGIEVHYAIYTKKISESYDQGNLNSDISIGSKSEIDLIIGRKIGIRSLLTLRGGIAFSNINLSAYNDFEKTLYVQDNKWNGFSLGMGYVYGINENLSIKTKYNLTTFKNNEVSAARAKLVDNRATLSLIYRIWSGS